MSFTVLFGIVLVTAIAVVMSIRTSLKSESARLSLMESFDRSNKAHLRVKKKR